MMIKDIIIAILTWVEGVIKRKINAKEKLTVINSEKKRKDAHDHVMNRVNKFFIWIPVIFLLSACSMFKSVFEENEIVVIADPEKVVYSLKKDVVAEVDIIGDSTIVRNKKVELTFPMIMYKPTAEELKMIYKND